MTSHIHCLIGASLLLSASVAAQAASPALQIRGRVELPGGGPAAHARLLVLHNNLNLERREIEADADGRFVITDGFLENTVVIARTADGALQRRMTIAENEARVMALGSLPMQLRPARKITARVTRDGRPVADVRVATEMTASQTVTDQAGEAVLFLPEGLERSWVAAWHPRLGVCGSQLMPDSSNADDARLELALQEPQPRRIRVVDHLGQPVPGLLVCPNFKPADTGWFIGRSLGSVAATTDVKGEVEFAWAPKKNKGFNLDGSWLQWVMEEIVRPADENESPTVRVRQKRPVAGRLIVPQGCDPSGLLIVGAAFGPASNGDYVATRAAADGSFSLMIAPEHAYAIEVNDRSWTSEPLTGVLTRQSSMTEPKPLELRVEPATPLEVRATIGDDRRPLPDNYVAIGRIIESEWVDAEGKRKSGQHYLGHWIRTDAAGIVRTGLGRGTNRVSIAHESWYEKQTLDVKSEAPLTVTFHKPYEHRRQIRGQLTQAGRTGDYSGVKITALEHRQNARKAVEVSVAVSGLFEFSTDCQTVDFLALDVGGSVCGNAAVTEVMTEVTIELRPMATYEGVVLSHKDKPLSAVGMTLTLQDAPDVFVQRTTTTRDGRFHFDRVFSGLPLRLSASHAEKEQALDQHYFEPGEMRQGVRVRIVPDDLDESAPPKPLAQQWSVLCRDAKLASMHALVAIHHDAESARFSERFVLDWEEAPAVIDYLPLELSVDELSKNEPARKFAQTAGWPIPKAGQVTLIIGDGAGKLLGTTTIAIDSTMAKAEARKFLESHRPPAVSGDELWRRALAEAKRSDRRVLVQIGGPRCGPCFLLSRWTDEHRATLERDYVLLKLQPGQQAGADELETRLRSRRGSIPWMAIVDSDGKVLATGDGPLGNIGFPGSFEDVRHLQRMLTASSHNLTADEIRQLVATLRE